MAKGDWISNSNGVLVDTVFEVPVHLGSIPSQYGEPGGGYPSDFDTFLYFCNDSNMASAYYESVEGYDFLRQEIRDIAPAYGQDPIIIAEFDLVDSLIAPEGGKCTFAIVCGQYSPPADGNYYLYFNLVRYVYDENGNRTTNRDFGRIYNFYDYVTNKIKIVAGIYSRNGYTFACFGVGQLSFNGGQYEIQVRQITETNFPNVTGDGYPQAASGDPNKDKDKKPTTNKIPKGDRRRGGDGTHDIRTDVIPLPTLPPKTATSTGFVTLYSVTEAILKLLADKLFSDTWKGAWDNFWQNADEAIAGLSIVPVTPTKGGRAKPRVGLYTLDVAMDTIASQYVEVDCGELFVDEYYGSAFDYSPYTKISIFLPYIGIRSLDVDEVMNRTIGVKYYCDVYSGSCMACIYVKVNPLDITVPGDTPTVKYTFSGNIAQQVPTAAASWDRMIQSGVALACVALPAIAAGVGSVGNGLMSAGYYQATTANASAYGTSQYAKNAMVSSWESAGSKQASMALEGATMAAGMSAKPTVERTGSLGSGVGFLGPQKPFLIRIIPRQSIPDEYMDFCGYPSNEYVTLGSLEGYAQVEDIHLTEVYATGPEKDEIRRLLKEGVLL